MEMNLTRRRQRQNPRGYGTRSNHAADETIVIEGGAGHTIDTDRLAEVLTGFVSRVGARATFHADGRAPFKTNIPKGDLATVRKIVKAVDQSPIPIHLATIDPLTAGGVVRGNPRGDYDHLDRLIDLARNARLISQPNSRFKARAHRIYKRLKQDPGDIGDLPNAIEGFAIAEAALGRGAGWLPEVQRIGFQIADLASGLTPVGIPATHRPVYAPAPPQAPENGDIAELQSKLGGRFTFRIYGSGPDISAYPLKGFSTDFENQQALKNAGFLISGIAGPQIIVRKMQTPRANPPMSTGDQFSALHRQLVPAFYRRWEESLEALGKTADPATAGYWRGKAEAYRDCADYVKLVLGAGPL